VPRLPGPEAYPPRDFRVEWGPVFHRGRLDGSARLLVIGQDPGVHEAVVRRILGARPANWNRGLELLFPAVGGGEVPRDLVPYGEALEPGDLAEIPAADLPAGLPPWMGQLQAFADRQGTTPELKRATIVITVPRAARPWRRGASAGRPASAVRPTLRARGSGRWSWWW
jgi:hypothetical protein